MKAICSCTTHETPAPIMKFINPIPFVHDVAISKEFYRSLLRLNVMQDHGDFVQFENGFALHDGAALMRTVFGEPEIPRGPYGRKNLVLYFESADIEGDFSRIAPSVRMIHAVEKQAWGQRVFRFFDPDGHIIEIGEPEAGRQE